MKRQENISERLLRRKTLNMTAENAVVKLVRSVPELGLLGDEFGTVVHVYSDGNAFEVEFPRAGGAVVITLQRADLCLPGEGQH